MVLSILTTHWYSVPNVGNLFSVHFVVANCRDCPSQSGDLACSERQVNSVIKKQLHPSKRLNPVGLTTNWSAVIWCAFLDSVIVSPLLLFNSCLLLAFRDGYSLMESFTLIYYFIGPKATESTNKQGTYQSSLLFPFSLITSSRSSSSLDIIMDALLWVHNIIQLKIWDKHWIFLLKKFKIKQEKIASKFFVNVIKWKMWVLKNEIIS